MALSADTVNRLGYGLTLFSAAAEIQAAIDAATSFATTQSIDATQFKNVTSQSPTPGSDVIFRFDIAAGALGNTDIIVAVKVRVVDVTVILTGAGVATTTFQVFNGASAISDAIAASGAIKTVTRAGQIDATAFDVAVGGTLRVTSATGATQPNAMIIVTCIRVP